MRRRIARRPPALLALATVLAPLALLHDGVRHAVESRMALHMLLEFPLLAAAGWALERLARPHWRGLGAVDAHGLLGLTLASCIGAFWMVPAALDLALMREPLRWAKVASWLVAGAALSHSVPRLRDETLVFFVGNGAWMLATVGLLYREAQQRLCVNYLEADQAAAGTGLVAAACGLGVLALARIARLGRAPPEAGLSSPPARETRAATRRARA